MTASSTVALAARGAKWVALGTAIQRLVQLAAVLVLARLLVPEDFGLVSIASILLALVTRIKNLGLHTALIQRQTDIQRAADATFVVNGLISALLYLCVLACSPLVSLFFDAPQAGMVLAILSLRMLPDAAAAVPFTLAVRELNFRAQTLIAVAEAVVNATVSLALAATGHGVWSLVVGSISGSMIAAVLWWTVTSWRPRWALDRAVLRELLGFGLQIWSAGNLDYIVEACARILIGRLLGVTTLGYYEITTRIVHKPLQMLTILWERVATPAFCREQDDLATLRRWYVRLVGYLLLLTAAVAGSLLLYADLIVPLLFGAKWLPAVEPARALSMYALLVPLLYGWATFVATGEVGLLLRFTAIRVTVTVTLLWIAAHHSLVAVCAVESLAACIFAPLNFTLISRTVGIRLREAASTIIPVIVPLAVFIAVGLGSQAVLPRLADETSFLSTVLQVLPALVAFLLAVVLMRPALIHEIRSVVALAIGSRAQGTADERSRLDGEERD